MKIMIVGGTGFLGYYTALAALEKGYAVSSLSVKDVPLDGWYPPQIEVVYGDVFAMGKDELKNIFKGYDALVYSIGPDDRVTPKAPAYDFFHQKLVVDCAKVFLAAQEAGVQKAVLYNSYFATFDRLFPQKELAKHHPYIACRVEQAQKIIEQSEGKMQVCVLELPYIFGAMPKRTPIWKDVFIERFFRYPMVFFPRGGTTMIHAKSVGQAGVGALERGEGAKRYPVGDENMTFKQMLLYMQEGLKIKKPILQPSKKICALGAKSIAKSNAKKGLESGLDMERLMLDIMGEELYIPPQTIEENATLLGYARGGVKEGIIEAMRACYPKGFKNKTK